MVKIALILCVCAFGAPMVLKALFCTKTYQANIAGKPGIYPVNNQ